MGSKFECPFCGGEVEVFASDCTLTARCTDFDCLAEGPELSGRNHTEAEAIHVFCHPAHLTVGMVMVSVGTAQTAIEALEIAYGEKDKDFVINPDVWSYEAQAHKDITAAIDAAKGEKV